MNRQPFMRPILHGPRFDGGGVPFEVLGDLAALEQMLVEVAKHKFRQANAGRIRAPRGFSDRVQLQLVAVADGSAVVEIALAVASAMLPGLEPERGYMIEARDAIVEGIAAAGAGQPITAFLPETTLGYFDRFGRSLRDGEWIELERAGRQSVRFDREVRRRLVLASPSANELTEEVALRGRVPEADQQTRSFHLLLTDGRKVKMPIDEAHLEVVIEAFNGWRSGQGVEVRGIGRFDRNNRLLGVDSVVDVTLLDPLDVAARIEELGTLRDGWLDGAGIAPSRDGLAWLEAWLTSPAAENLPAPHLYPTPEGGVQAEWTIGASEVSAEIDLENKSAAIHRLDLSTGADTEDVLDLVDPVALERLAAILASAETAG